MQKSQLLWECECQRLLKEHDASRSPSTKLATLAPWSDKEAVCLISSKLAERISRFSCPQRTDGDHSSRLQLAKCHVAHCKGARLALRGGGPGQEMTTCVAWERTLTNTYAILIWSNNLHHQFTTSRVLPCMELYWWLQYTVCCSIWGMIGLE